MPACGDSPRSWSMSATAEIVLRSGDRKIISFKADPYGSLLDAERLAREIFYDKNPDLSEEETRIVKLTIRR